MQIRRKVQYLPLRTFSFLFVIWNNSQYAVVGKSAGFFCDDESIKKPYHGDSVRVSYLFTILLGVFALIIYLSEIIFRDETSNNSSQCKLLLRYYYSGFLHVIAVTEVLKCFITELRPHFFYTCLPDMSKIDCSKGLVTGFNCTGTDAWWLVDVDIYKSFPSGHSALSAFAFIFICVYLYSRRSNAVQSCVGVWWSRIIPLLCLAWTVVCCASRILDNRHFWWDVLSGIFIGIIGGFITISFALNKAAPRSKSL